MTDIYAMGINISGIVIIDYSILCDWSIDESSNYYNEYLSSIEDLYLHHANTDLQSKSS
jgi:hypothetical protein